jgi:D-glycero-alpha-D-manno-heptose-7-phosphate kinase
VFGAVRIVFVRIRSHAPVRTADLGGWTDTWFSRSGVVCNVAVEPGITVKFLLAKSPISGVSGQASPVMIDARMNGTSAIFELDSLSQIDRLREGANSNDDPVNAVGGIDPLLAALLLRVPPHRNLRIRVEAGVPVGSGLGTSAAFAVAMLAGLHALHQRTPTPAELASEAHTVETSLGLQSGVQDQYAAAFGGVRLYEFDYPVLLGEPKEASLEATRYLDARLLTLYLGHPHSSSMVHSEVIVSLEEKRHRSNEALLAPLRDAAAAGFKALGGPNFDEYGRAMRANSSAQRALHPSLVSEGANAVITVIRLLGARGWKVNGAGGEGGSMSVFGPDKAAEHAALIVAINKIPDVSVLNLRVARSGVSVVAY